jgi:hypothetical protein
MKMKIRPLTRSKKIQYTKIFKEAIKPFEDKVIDWTKFHKDMIKKNTPKKRKPRKRKGKKINGRKFIQPG